MLSREEDELRELLDFFESAFLTFSPWIDSAWFLQKISMNYTRRKQGVRKRVSVSVSCFCGAFKPSQTFNVQCAMILFRGEIFLCFLVYELY